MKEDISGDLFQEYEKRNYGPEEIFRLIDNQTISQTIAIKLIENYGLRKVRESIGTHRYSSDISKIIDRLNEQLDELLDRTIQMGTKKPKKRRGT